MSRFRKSRKQIKYSLLVVTIKLLLVAVRVLPRILTMKLFSSLGALAFILLKEERTKAVNNLRIAYGPEKSEAEIQAMAKEVFVNLAKSGAEFAIKMNRKKPEQFFKDLEVRGEEHLRKAAAKGKGILALVSHMGSWECTALVLPMLGISTYAIGKKLGNEKLNNLLFESRGKMGVQTLARGSSYKAMLRVLKENNLLGILIDQDTDVRGVFVDFYDKPAYTPIGGAMLAMDSGAPVLPIFYLKKEDDTYEFIVEEEIPLVKTGNRRRDMEENTRIFHGVIEKYIKKYPTQWVWMHNRWKTTPEMVEAKKQMREKKKNATAQAGFSATA
ncbi:MAG: lysophospholipid acyltransferase family protein [Deltaproteobacteria bacterium]|jgi:KDO2-lipid IV(A) lauroyltransferase|nr:lysophospholipid acyltransferase family protein [Deltaproteobacteria bacterium]